jgi:hypothetical protein
MTTGVATMFAVLASVCAIFTVHVLDALVLVPVKFPVI